MEYEITFDRTDESATFRCYRTRGQDPYFDMARVLVAHGWEDGPGTFIDETGLACLTVQSIHACARRYRPTEAEYEAKVERWKGRKTKPAQTPLEGRDGACHFWR